MAVKRESKIKMSKSFY